MDAFGAVVSHRLNVTVDGAAADRQVTVETAAVRPSRDVAVDRAALDGSSCLLYTSLQARPLSSSSPISVLPCGKRR